LTTLNPPCPLSLIHKKKKGELKKVNTKPNTINVNKNTPTNPENKNTPTNPGNKKSKLKIDPKNEVKQPI
jgi:hypothetical protein